MIPDTISRDHIMAALAQLAGAAIPPSRQSVNYDLPFNGKLFPPKYVIGVAAKLATGKDLPLDSFKGGAATNAFLKKRGFEVLAKKGKVASASDPARETFEKLVPNEEARELCALILAVGIEEAHAAGAARWETSLRTHVIRLNGGRAMIADVMAEEVFVGVDANALDADTHARLEQDADRREAFAALPAFECYRIPADRVAGLWPAIEPGFRAFARAAALTAKRSPWARFHDDRVLAYLERLVDHPLPRPDFGVEKAPGESSKLRPFDALMAAIRAEKLSFADELVAHYLLALQAKRFVILTGVSGTGKTQLSLAVAKSLVRPIDKVTIVAPPSDAATVRVSPYMSKYGRLVVPKAVAPGLQYGGAVGGASAPVDVEYPGGQVELQCRRELRGGHTVDFLFFKGEFRTWFKTTFQIGDEIVLEVLDPSASGRDRIRVTLPQKNVETVTPRNHVVVTVRPDWTDNRGLLGYYNPLTKRYVRTPFLELLLRAGDEAERARIEDREPAPYFAILDEMNLARVEQYFSDFISAMESGEPIALHDDELVEAGEVDDAEDGEDLPVPRELAIPSNVFFTGTVNVDETTFMFSPKVLDRAFVIEFNDVDLQRYGAGGEPDGPAEEASPLWLSDWKILPPATRVSETDWNALADVPNGEGAKKAIIDLNAVLRRDNRHFGYRVANEIGRFIVLAATQADDPTDGVRDALDLAIKSKVLPKLHGTQQEIEDMLAGLFSFAAGDMDPPVPYDGWALDDGVLRAKSGAAPRFPRSAAKLWRMLRRLRQQGFTSFIE